MLPCGHLINTNRSWTTHKHYCPLRLGLFTVKCWGFQTTTKCENKQIGFERRHHVYVSSIRQKSNRGPHKCRLFLFAINTYNHLFTSFFKMFIFCVCADDHCITAFWTKLKAVIIIKRGKSFSCNGNKIYILEWSKGINFYQLAENCYRFLMMSVSPCSISILTQTRLECNSIAFFLIL